MSVLRWVGRPRARSVWPCLRGVVVLGVWWAGGMLEPARAQGPAAVPAAQQVVVTAAREPLAPERVAGDVVVITEETIRATTADSLADLLRREAGLQLSRAGGPGQGSGVLIRGAAAGQTVVLVDGVRVGSATLGLAALEQIGLEQVERIEVLRGPGSTLHGADAVGGVVQVFTRRAQGPLAGDLALSAGGYGSRTGSVFAAAAQGALDWAASLSDERSQGVSVLRPGDRFGNYNPDADGWRLQSAHLRLGWRSASGHRVEGSLLRTRLNARYDSAEYAPPSWLPDPSPDFRNRVDTAVQALQWSAPLGSTLSARARLTAAEDDATVGGRSPDRFRTQREQALLELSTSLGAPGRLTAAVEHGRDRASSSLYTGAVQRRHEAFLLALAGASAPLSWQAELRRDDPSDHEAVDTARLGASWRPGPGWRLRGLAGSTFRAPSFNDLHYPGYGVPTLRPERGRSVEAGLSWAGVARPGREPSLRAEATLWRNRVNDLIGYEPDRRACPPGPAYDFGCARNINRARLQGLTLSMSGRAGALSWRTQADWLRARDATNGEPLPRRASRQASGQAEWAARSWTFGTSVQYLGARPEAGITLPPQTTVDLSARWQFAPAWQLQAKLLNATDEPVQPARDYQGLGRQAWLGFRVALGPGGGR